MWVLCSRKPPHTGKVSSWCQEHGCHQGSFQQLWGDGLHLLPMYIPGRDQTQGEQGWQLRGELPWKQETSDYRQY